MVLYLYVHSHSFHTQIKHGRMLLHLYCLVCMCITPRCPKWKLMSQNISIWKKGNVYRKHKWELLTEQRSHNQWITAATKIWAPQMSKNPEVNLKKEVWAEETTTDSTTEFHRSLSARSALLNRIDRFQEFCAQQTGSRDLASGSTLWTERITFKVPIKPH